MIRQILISCFLLGSALLAFLTGARIIEQWQSHPAPLFSPLVKGIEAERDFPLTEHKSFAIVLYGHNAAQWCERALRSVFEQDYDYYRVLFVDDGSVDGTLERAQQFIVDHNQDHRVIAIRNETPLGPVASLYRAVDNCIDKEIVIPLDANNWFANENVLSRLSHVFQNPDTWIAFGQSIQYPIYQISEPPHFDRALIERKGFRSLPDFDGSALAFYAALFKSIHLPDLFVDGRFSTLQQSYLTPLLEQSGGRIRRLGEPFIFVNLTRQWRNLDGKLEKIALKRVEPYKPLAQFPSTSVRHNSSLEVVLFSFDRPLQLFAALESIERYLNHYSKLTVLYRVSDARYEEAYGSVISAFPDVHFIKQSDPPRKNFKPKLLKILFDSPAEYVVFGVDDAIVKDFVDLNLCKQMLEKTGAHAFYLRFGRNIHHSYVQNRPLCLPPSVPLSSGIYAWDLKKGEADWNCPTSLEMVLYRKSDLKPIFEMLQFKNPQSLKAGWSEKSKGNQIGLYFEGSKVISQSNQHINYTVEELLLKFNQGFKIDIDPLYKVENPAPHYETIPEFVQR